MSNVGKKIFLNILALVATEVTIKCLGIVLMMAVARKLGPTIMGVYAFSLTFIWFFEVAINYGLSGYIEREIGRYPETAPQLLARVFGLKLLLMALSLVIILVLIPFVANKSPKMEVVLILALGMYFETNTQAIFAFFRGQLKSHFEAVVTLVFRLSYTTAAILAIWNGGGLIILVSLGAATSILTFFMAWFVFRRKIGRIPGLPSWTSIIGLARSAFYLFLGTIAIAVFNSIDMIMLSVLSGDVPTGFYSVAVRLIGSFDFLPAAFAGAFLPVLSRMSLKGPTMISGVFEPYFKFILLLGGGIGVMLAMLSKDIILFLFGPEFLPATHTLALMSVAMVFIFINWVLSATIIALDKESSLLRIYAACAIFNVLINLVLIPYLEDQGAAWATIFSLFLLLLLQCAQLGPELRKAISISPLSIPPLLTGALTWLLLYLLGPYHLNLFFNLALAGVGFIIFAFLTRALRYRDLELLREFVIRKEAPETIDETKSEL